MSRKLWTIKLSQLVIRSSHSTQCLWITLNNSKTCLANPADSPHLKLDSSSSNNMLLISRTSSLNSIAIRAISTRRQGHQIMIYDNSMHTRAQPRTKIHTLDRSAICKHHHLKVHNNINNSRESSPSHHLISNKGAAQQNSWKDLHLKSHLRQLLAASRNRIKINSLVQLIKWKHTKPTLQYFIHNSSRHKFKWATEQRMISLISWEILGMTCRGAQPLAKVEPEKIMSHPAVPMMLKSEKWRPY